jgi:3-hydroxybutyrate dehydrogenase
MAPFAGSAAIVIGGGRNIGREVVFEFVRRGARVAVADLDFEGAQETAALVRDMGGEACALSCDVGSEQSLHGAADQAERQFGAMDLRQQEGDER